MSLGPRIGTTRFRNAALATGSAARPWRRVPPRSHGDGFRAEPTGPLAARRAYSRGRAAQRAHELELARLQGSLLETGGPHPDHVRILVVGHSYNLADELIGKPIIAYLESLGVEVITSDAVEKPLARELSARLSPGIKWTYNKELLGAVELYREVVDGIVFVVTFPCGPDSLMGELCQRRIKGVPVATIVLDELQAEAGLRTRLESFVDIIQAKRRASAMCGVEA